MASHLVFFAIALLRQPLPLSGAGRDARATERGRYARHVSSHGARLTPAMAANVLAVALAGTFGALGRYGVSALIHNAGWHAPWPTFAVNVLGCLLFGVAFAVLDARTQWDPTIRLAVLTGFLGAFTTFSTFAFDNAALVREGQYGLAALNIAGQNALGIAALFAGLALATRFIPPTG